MARAEFGFHNPLDLIQYGPLIDVQVGFDPDYRPAPVLRAQLPPDTLLALVDTGAQESALDAELAATLDLPVVGRNQIAGAGGVFETTVYMAQIYIPALDFTIIGPFDSANLATSGQPYRAIIGRTFLRYFNLEYEGRTGDVIISND